MYLGMYILHMLGSIIYVHVCLGMCMCVCVFGCVYGMCVYIYTYTLYVWGVYIYTCVCIYACSIVSRAPVIKTSLGSIQSQLPFA